MPDYLITLELLEPACIATQKGVGNVIPTLDYIPGSSVRGAIAELWLQANSARDAEGNFTINDEFERLFLSEAVHYGNCTLNHSRPIPLTAMSCKYYDGFSGSEPGKHGVIDLLAAGAGTALVQNGSSVVTSCDKCPEPIGILDAYNGYCRFESGVYKKERLRKRFMARTRISEYFDAAHHGDLYTRIALEAGQKFKGKLTLSPATDRGILESLLQKSQNEIHLGGAKSRSTGRTKINLHNYPSGWPNENGVALSERFDLLQERLTGLPGAFFTVTAISDVILSDNYLRYKTWLDMADLIQAIQHWQGAEKTPAPEIADTAQFLDQFELVRGWCQSHQVSGWQAAWKIPKFDEMAIAAGSVFLFRFKEPRTFSNAPLGSSGKSEREIFFAAMQGLETYGVGERRNEGFGQIRICDYFHTAEVGGW